MEMLGAAWQNCRVAGSLIAVNATLGCVLLCFFFQWYKKGKRSPAAPGPPLPPGQSYGFYCISETFHMLRAIRGGTVSSFMRVRTGKFGSKTFRTRFFFYPMVMVQGADANRFIALAENKKQLVNCTPASALQILGKHFPIAMHGAEHRRLRQIIASCVRPLALQKLVGRADLMTRLHFESCWPVQQSQKMSLGSLISRHFFSLACSLLFGVEEEDLVAGLHHHFKVWTKGILALPLDFPGTTFRKAKDAKRTLVRELGKLIDRKQLQAEENYAANHGAALEGKGEDMLGMLLTTRDENGSSLTPEEVQDLMLFLLMAGQDTSAATLAFVLKFLEQNPACYHRLCQEHTTILSKKSQKETLNWADIQSMKYTWAVIQETLRLRPIAQGGVKEAVEDVNFDGYKIPKGWKVGYGMVSTHLDETFFLEANKFDPSRFEIDGLPNSCKPPPYVYVPFGIGPHSCLGGDFARMFMAIYLHHLALGRFKWKSCDPDEKTFSLPILQLAKGYEAYVDPKR